MSDWEICLAKLSRYVLNRDAAITAAYSTGAYSYGQIAEFLGVHLATVVDRVIRKAMLQVET